ncbi:hypothetical protein J3A83DRAFT_2919466 [Scleroderma citrinum]
MTNNPNKGNPAGNPQSTPNRDAALEELVTSAVVNALQKVTTGLGELQNRLEPIEVHIGANTVTDHAKMLQTHLTPINTHIDTLQTQVLQGIDQCVSPLNDNLNALHDHIDQRINHLSHSVEMIREEVMAVGGAQTRLAAETRVREAQVSSTFPFLVVSHYTPIFCALLYFSFYYWYIMTNVWQRFNAGCGSGLTRQFEIVPFISDDTAHFPGIVGIIFFSSSRFKYFTFLLPL